ncbi:Imm49 family immunity protein [uncultured Paraglaciecola sp.]|uniref:Imm49 family immunity protein n=1 Tax=uncultured Paraglaciecola sp. TaxID=1765024 RepID=UPI0030D840B0|tara:strand:- start:183499 stop:184263 length:765 start_codon:yes stop_codon:yes gene_type:complete
MDFEQVGEALSYEIAFFKQGLDNPEMPQHEKGDLVNKLIDQTQALAIMVLLVRGNSDIFIHNLIRAALIRKRFLSELLAADKTQVYHQCSGRIHGFISAVAAQDFHLARDLVQLTPTDFQNTMEYEEDYCYAQLLYHLVAQHLNAIQIESLIARHDELTGESVRTDVIRGILQKDANNFEDAFEALIVEQEELIEKNIKRGQLDTPEVLAHRKVFIEGIALINLAKIHGIKITTHYQFCPANSLVAMTAPFPGE